MGFISHRSIVPASGDTDNVLLQKIALGIQSQQQASTAGLDAVAKEATLLGVSREDTLQQVVAALGMMQPNRDAFYRLRVSDLHPLVDSKQILDYTTLLWDDAQVSGAGTGSVHDPARASTTLIVSVNTAGRRVRQTFRRFNYQPGKSQLYVGTFVLGGTTAGITRRIGLFDDSNGYFFEQVGSVRSFVIRSSVTGVPVDTGVTQANWNTDTLDGSGPSGLTFDPTKAQILFIDFEWLGVGTVRFGFYINGVPVVCHTQHHANLITGVYTSNPNLPMRFEISNSGVGATAQLETICCTVATEGGDESPGLSFVASRGATSIQTNNDTNIYPIVGIRLRSVAAASATVIPRSVSLVCTSTSAFEWMVLRNPTIAGAALSSTVISPAVEGFLSPVNTNLLTGGVVVASGVAIQNNEASLVAHIPLAWALGVSIAGVSDVFFLGVRRLTGTTETFYGSMTYAERA